MTKCVTSVFVALVFLSQPVWAAKAKKDFSAFKGSYSGTSSLAYNGSVGTGTATVVISVPKNGRSATMTIQGNVNFSGTNYPLAATITMAGGSTSISDLALGIANGTLYPGSGSYQNTSVKSFAFNAAGTLSGAGSVSVKPIGKKKKQQTVTINYTLTAFGSPYVFTIVLQGKAPKLPTK